MTVYSYFAYWYEKHYSGGRGGARAERRRLLRFEEHPGERREEDPLEPRRSRRGRRPALPRGEPAAGVAPPGDAAVRAAGDGERGAGRRVGVGRLLLPVRGLGRSSSIVHRLELVSEDHDLLETRRRPGAGRAGLRAAARLRGGADRRHHALRPGHAGASIGMRPRSHFIFAGISYVDFFYVLICVDILIFSKSSCNGQ